MKNTIQIIFKDEDRHPVVHEVKIYKRNNSIVVFPKVSVEGAFIKIEFENGAKQYISADVLEGVLDSSNVP